MLEPEGGIILTQRKKGIPDVQDVCFHNITLFSCSLNIVHVRNETQQHILKCFILLYHSDLLLKPYRILQFVCDCCSQNAWFCGVFFQKFENYINWQNCMKLFCTAARDSEGVGVVMSHNTSWRRSHYFFLFFLNSSSGFIISAMYSWYSTRWHKTTFLQDHSAT